MRPTPRSVLLLAIGFPIALLPALGAPSLWPLWLSFVAAAVMLTTLDSLLMLPAARLDVSVTDPSALYIGDSDELVVDLSARQWPRRLRIEALCDLDHALLPEPTRTVLIGAGSSGTASFRLTAKRRGRVRIERIWLRWTGPLGLASRTHCHEVGAEIPVVPNVRAVRSAALRFFAADAQLGLKVDRHRGDGSEFEALRDYIVGMDHRSIDWKQSARHRKLVSKEFRTERNHQIVLAIDTGYLMSEPLDGIPKLDHAINAALMLGYFSLRAGDRVSLYAFDAAIRAFTEPQGGVAAFPRLQHLSADLDYHNEETNFTLGLAELAARLKRRSLVVVLTDFVDPITAELMVENLQRLARRHLVLFVATRDPNLERVADARPDDVRDVHRAVVANQLDRERDVVVERLRRSGVHCIDVAPEQVSIEMLNSYLDIKRREMI